MITPTKHQLLSDNVLVIGAELLHEVRNEGFPLEKLIHLIKKKYSVKTDLIIDTLVFLWMLDAINVESGMVSKVNSENVPA